MEQCLRTNDSFNGFCRSLVDLCKEEFSMIPVGCTVQPDSSTEGYFDPQAMTAHIDPMNKDVLQLVFHELFGHGLFFTHSSLRHEEATEDLKLKVEQFALYVEYMLSARFHCPIRPQCDGIRSAMEGDHGRLSVMAGLGMPLMYSPREAYSELLSYAPELGLSDIVLLYGSRNPTSDIDFFALGTEGKKIMTPEWIDLYSVGHDEFQYMAYMHDISVVDPLFTGELVYGDQAVLDRIKAEIRERPIKASMIHHNYQRALDHGQLIGNMTIPGCFKIGKTAESYAKSYAKTAEMLVHGVKPYRLIDLDCLKEKDPRFS